MILTCSGKRQSTSNYYEVGSTKSFCLPLPRSKARKRDKEAKMNSLHLYILVTYKGQKPEGDGKPYQYQVRAKSKSSNYWQLLLPIWIRKAQKHESSKLQLREWHQFSLPVRTLTPYQTQVSVLFP